MGLTPSRDDIGGMPLYVNPHRIYNELRELGIGAACDAIDPERLFPFDQIHYHGTDAVATAAGVLQLGPSSRVLDVGAGLGGPARYLAHTTGCHVTALELQEPMHRIASDLTARTGLFDRVRHVHGDALTHPLPERAFDAVVSWLAVHQIPKRPLLFQRLVRALRPDGRIYLEDLGRRGPFSPAELVDVREMLYAETMTGPDEYERELRDAGCTAVDITDMTGDWGRFSAARAAAWRAARDRHVRVHGEETYQALDAFFSTVARLFAGGHLGGWRIVATC
jgi:cyclopropane fatty-acyl-phospholipid synthase-like methyltransferase